MSPTRSWEQIAADASKELDPKKLAALTQELNEAIKEHLAKQHARSMSGGDESKTKSA